MIYRDELLNRHKLALVNITVNGTDVKGTNIRPKTGNGVIVGESGVIVTAKHVVGENKDWLETSPDSGVPKRTINVVGLDKNDIRRDLGCASVHYIENLDIALLYINASNLQTVQLADSLPPENSNVVALIWNPNERPQPIDAYLLPTDQSRHSDKLTVRLSVAEGNSGSGLFDANFRLVGIIVSDLDGHRALAVPVLLFKEQIDRRIASASGSRGPTAAPQAPSLSPRIPNWEDKSRDSGWYELLEVRKDIDEFGDVQQTHKICHIHGPREGRIEDIPYTFRTEAPLGTCVIKRIRNKQANLDIQEIPEPAAQLEGILPLVQPATVDQQHAGFTLTSALINAYSVTTDDDDLRGLQVSESHSRKRNEVTTVAAAYPARMLRLIVLFPLGYQPKEVRVAAHTLRLDNLSETRWEKNRDETARITPHLYYDFDRAFAVLAVAFYLPDNRYELTWLLPNAPKQVDWNQETAACKQVKKLLSLKRTTPLLCAQMEETLTSIRNEILRGFFDCDDLKDIDAVLSLMAFDTESNLLRVVITTDDVGRHLTLRWGVGVAGRAMRRRKPTFVDPKDAQYSGIYSRADGTCMERHIYCVPIPLPLPLPVNKEEREKLGRSARMPCVVLSLSCRNGTCNLEKIVKSEDPEWLEKVNETLVNKCIDLVEQSVLR